jgi:hypothetical protein
MNRQQFQYYLKNVLQQSKIPQNEESNSENKFPIISFVGETWHYHFTCLLKDFQCSPLPFI